MHHPVPQAAPARPATGEPAAASHAAESGAGAVSISLMNRVGRVLQDLSAARTVGDDEIRQHARDCTFLQESAYDRYQASGLAVDREEAYVWMNRRDQALASLSPQWKAAREAQRLREAEAGGCYFVEQGERDRMALAGRVA